MCACPASYAGDLLESACPYLIMLGDMYASGPRTIDGINTFAQGMYPDLAR